MIPNFYLCKLLNSKSKIFIPFFLLHSLNIFSQSSPLDSLTLDTLTAYTSIEEAMKNPEKVIKLELRKQKLKTFPVEIFSFPNLQYLDLSKNKLKEIPSEISQLKNLQWFSVSKNLLQILPYQIGELTNLYYLNANQNDIVSIPTTIGKLINLKNFDLWSNNIDKFPEEMKDMKSLQILDLRVVLISQPEQNRLERLLPETKIFFSPACNCQQ